jgi:integrase
VNFEQGIISILSTKNNERRDIPMNDTLKAALAEIERKGPCMFCNGDSETFANVRRSFETALRKSKIEDFRFHDLRHTFASTPVIEGKELNTVRELLGHKDLTMTLRYAHLAPDYKKKAVAKLDRIMLLNPPYQKVVKNVVAIIS